MPKTAGEILFAVATAIGVPSDDPSLESIKNNKDLFTLSVSPAFEAAYDKEFTTITAAKNNGEIKKHFNGLALGTIDNKMDEIMTEFGFDDNTKAEIKKQDSTYKRNETLIRKVKALGEKAAGTTDGKEKDKLVSEIQALHTKIAENDKAFKDSMAAEASKWQNEISSMVLERKLTERPLIDSFDGGKTLIPSELVLNTAKGYIEKAAADKGAKIVYDHSKKGFHLVQASNPDLPYMENHKNVTFDEFRDSVLANNKLIKVTTTGAAPKFTASNTTNAQGQVQESKRAIQLRSSVDEDIANLTNAPANVG